MRFHLVIGIQVVSIEEGEALALEYNIRYVETSAMQGINVDTPFLAIAADVMDRLATELPSHDHGHGSLHLAANGQEERGQCCQ